MSLKQKKRLLVLLLVISTLLFVSYKWTLSSDVDNERGLQLQKEHFNDATRSENIQYILENRISELKFFQGDQVNPQTNNATVVNNKRENTQTLIPVECTDRICTKYLTETDFPHYRYCIAKTWGKKIRPGTPFKQEPVQSQCKFLDGSTRDAIALASYPGSGNTWLRGLLQGVTGLCTGAVYCDVSLRRNGYPGESLRSGVVLVVKIHEVDPRWTGVYYKISEPFTYFKKVEDIPVFSSAVFIIRNPLDAMVAEYNRILLVDSGERYINHVETVDDKNFGSNSQWSTFMSAEAEKWQRTVLSWLTENRNHPVLVVKYEQLQTDTARELKRVLEFLKVPYSSMDLERIVGEGYDRFRRSHNEKTEFEHYTSLQREYVRDIVKKTSEILATHNVVNISDYL